MTDAPDLVHDELTVLSGLVPLAGARIIELGCGAAGLARRLIEAHPDASYLGCEVDHIQHARNLSSTVPGMRFEAGGAQAIAQPDGSFDLALMLKSLHHVPLDALDQALAEVARVLVPGGHLYVSEPVYGGALNELIVPYNDEGEVRAAAQAALDRALAAAASPWQQVASCHFDMPVHFDDFAQFEQRMMHPTFKDHHLTPAVVERVRTLFMPHCGPQGADFLRPMHVRLLRKRG